MAVVDVGGPDGRRAVGQPIADGRRPNRDAVDGPLQQRGPEAAVAKAAPRPSPCGKTLTTEPSRSAAPSADTVADSVRTCVRSMKMVLVALASVP